MDSNLLASKQALLDFFDEDRHTFSDCDSKGSLSGDRGSHSREVQDASSRVWLGNVISQ